MEAAEEDRERAFREEVRPGSDQDDGRRVVWRDTRFREVRQIEPGSAVRRSWVGRTDVLPLSHCFCYYTGVWLAVCSGQKVKSMQTLKILGALAALATVVPAFAQNALAQTQGMERRDDRRDTRQDSRAVKQACKAGDDKSRAECRQEKRDVKQTGRQGDQPAMNTDTTTSPPH